VNNKSLPLKFFERKPEVVARDLIGKYLVREMGESRQALMITEVEAYAGAEDLASHARFGKTKRNEVMFGKAGVFYIYFIYGMYFMLNVVCQKRGVPSAVLIRGVAGITGPGKLTKNFKIDKSLSGKQAEIKSGLWFEDRGSKIKTERYRRIGVNYAGEWSRKLWRFTIENKNIVE